jgi:ferredoxin
MAKDELAELEIDVSKCMHCGACVGSCPVNAMFLDEVVVEVNDGCNLCKRCIKVCPVGAISLIGGR